ncbi:glycoside hydrolase family 71 protein [Xylaria sp. CBS 124048]|nr:glycoside hydrolase family 71 protein [Xylaria sp. CBS 124048]
MGLLSFLPVAAALAKFASADPQVFAHYLVGLTFGQTRDEWVTDITQAIASGIEGFALNVGAQDLQNDDQLALAYDVASENNFALFLSFDMQASQWTQDQIITYINTYKGLEAQLLVDGLPVVSTFEGPSQASIWPAVRAATGDIHFIPNWSSLGAPGVGNELDLIDGAFNWGAWPNANELNMTTGNDIAYQLVLGDKSYMMGVSPYFYTDLPGKNWYSSSDSLWFDRWNEVMTIMPDFIELITWNDFGESSYLNAPIARQIVAGAEVYADGFDHTAFRFVLPYFIAAYKAGSTDVAIPQEGAMAWYRTNPVGICSDNGTVWGQGGTVSADQGTNDVVSVIALTEVPTDITVQIGSAAAQTVSPINAFGKASFYEVPFSGATGAVTVTINGASVTGPEITAACPASGHENFNAVSIQVAA